MDLVVVGRDRALAFLARFFWAYFFGAHFFGNAFFGLLLGRFFSALYKILLPFLVGWGWGGVCVEVSPRTAFLIFNLSELSTHFRKKFLEQRSIPSSFFIKNMLC
jgi:hypothetical protein